MFVCFIKQGKTIMIMMTIIYVLLNLFQMSSNYFNIAMSSSGI